MIIEYLILIDSFFKNGKSYYPQVLLEECKHIVKEKWEDIIMII